MPGWFEADEANPTATLVFETVDGDSDVNITRRALKPEGQATIKSLPEGSALLIVLSGPNSEARFLFGEDRTNAGRHQKSDIFLDDATVSHGHAQLVRSDDGFFVRNSGLLNGTYANRGRTDAHALHMGDEIQIGKFRLTFYEAPATA